MICLRKFIQILSMYQDLVVMYLHYLRYVFIVYMPRVSKIIIISNLYMLSLKVALKNS